MHIVLNMLLRNSEKYKWFSPRLGSITIHVKRLTKTRKYGLKNSTGERKKSANY